MSLIRGISLHSYLHAIHANFNFSSAIRFVNAHDADCLSSSSRPRPLPRGLGLPLAIRFTGILATGDDHVDGILILFGEVAADDLLRPIRIALLRIEGRTRVYSRSALNE